MFAEPWFEGKVALVTGGADGIGRAAALLFAQRAARVVVTDVDVAKGQRVVEEIRDTGGTAMFAPGDVTDKAQVAAFVTATIAEYGRLDTALNNAGITDRLDSEWDEDAFDRTLAINLKGVWTCIKAEVPAMRQTGGGTIVNTASIAAFISTATMPPPAYVASKHGVVGLTKAAALAHVGDNIRVNSVCPGVTDTPAVRALVESSPDIGTALRSLSPMGRLATSEEIAEAAIWLASVKSSFVTGHALVVDGGSIAM